MSMTTADQQRRISVSEPNANLLEVSGLTVEVKNQDGWVTLVKDIDLAVRRGETVGLVGESGSGKTISSLAVMRLLPTNTKVHGSVRLGGRELTELSSKHINRVRGVDMAMIFQEPRRSLNPAFTVGDQVAEAVRQHRDVSRREAWSRAIELFERVGIPDPAKRALAYPHQFSGGMCQRVMLAMALSCNPQLLIADEPTTALDVSVQRQVLELIYDVQQEFGLGVLIITHDLGVVAEVCDRAAVMYAGEIVEQATVMKLFDNPQHPYTAGLIHSMPDPIRHAERMGAIPGMVPAPANFVETCRFAARCPFHVKEVCSVRAIPLVARGLGHRARCARTDDLDLSEAFYA